MRPSPILSLLLPGVLVAPAAAQDAPPAEAEAEAGGGGDEGGDPEAGDEAEAALEGEEIVVTGTRRGAVAGDIPPEITLDARDIRAYGASNLTELLDALGPQTGSGRGREGGRPVVLLNGKRISGFREIANLPPEAIERVDILPEEVALKYGYAADQRVVNFVLRPRFRAVTTEAEGTFATAGGRERYEADLNVLRISNDGRWEVDAEYDRSGALLESERDIIEIESGPRDPLVPSLASFRTLIGASEQLQLSGTVSRTVLTDISATLTGRYEATENVSLFGLPSADLLVPAENPFARRDADETVFRYLDVGYPLRRVGDNRQASLGLALNGRLEPWNWSFTGNWERASSDSRTGRGIDAALLQERIAAGDPAIDPFGPLTGDLLVARPSDRAQTMNGGGNAELVMTGPLLRLPAGPVQATFKAGADTRYFESETLRSGIVQARALSRDRASGQANIDVPVASRRREVLSAVGDLSLNANAAVEALSDFGTLRTLGAGINWSPIEAVRVIASVTDEDGAPSMQQLGNPLVVTPNVRVFDFLRGETVDISRIDGGNSGLVADNRRVYKLGVNVRPLGGDTDLSLRADYTNSRIVDPIASFPTATQEIEAAFPERFVRDAGGRLLQIDSRPVNFARSDSEELRWGFNFSKPIASKRPPRGAWRGGRGGAGRPGASEDEQAAGAAAPAQRAQGQRQGGQPHLQGEQAPQGQQGQAPPAEGAERAQRSQNARPPTPGGGWRGGRGGFGRGGLGQGGRLHFSLYHTWRFEDSILIRPGVPELDLLGGSAVGSRGGRPRHELQAQAGVFRNGLGARLSASWQSGTTVRGGPDGRGGTTGDLRFSDFTSVNLRLFANLAEQPALIREAPWLRGTRLSLVVNNLFDSRIRVRDETGATPLNYQPDYLDPLGRSVTVSLRKMFF